MKYKIVIAFWCIALTAGAQSADVQEVIDAENAFAALSKDTNTRTAFVSNLATDGVVFAKGVSVNGLETWQKRVANDYLLFWWPEQADIASSSDLGYTTGPYFVNADRKSSQHVAVGYYSTVWKKESGVWKVAVDLGVSVKKLPSEERGTVKAPSAKISKVRAVSDNDLILIGRDYDEKLNARHVTYLPDYLSREARVHRNDTLPMAGVSHWKKYRDRGDARFEWADGAIAQSGDLGYTYGKVTLKEPDKEPIALNYLRVWKRKSKGGWEIVLDVIGG